MDMPWQMSIDCFNKERTILRLNYITIKMSKVLIVYLVKCAYLIQYCYHNISFKHCSSMSLKQDGSISLLFDLDLTYNFS